MHPHPLIHSERIVAFPRTRLNDAQLARAIANGDREALTTVWARYSGDVRRVVESGVAREPVRPELVREVFLAFFQRVHRYEQPEALRAHLLGIAARLSLAQQRKGWAQQSWAALARAASDRKSASITPYELCMQALRRELAQLPAVPRLAFVLYYCEKLPLAQTAQALQLTLTKASHAVASGRERLLHRARIELVLNRFLASTVGAAAVPLSAFEWDIAAAHALGALLHDDSAAPPMRHREDHDEAQLLLISHYARRRANANRRAYALLALAAVLALFGCAMLWRHLHGAADTDSQRSPARIHERAA